MIVELLKLGVKSKASDIHIGKDVPPLLRIHGALKYTDFPVFTESYIKESVRQLINPDQWSRFERNGELDLAISLPEIKNRFRVNIYKSLGSIQLAIRIIPNYIPTLEQLKVPEVVYNLTKLKSGLILITGLTGSGKSSTLAGMINKINNERSCHIITLEDPVEFIHKPIKSMISHREIYSDSKDFATGLRSALREDPDVIMVGEMRDTETIAAAITAAETGHLVLATLHTGNAPQSINRIIDGFPAHQQQQIRMQLSLTLKGIICQQLITNIHETGRALATEILIATQAVRNIIREGNIHLIASEIDKGIRHGMHTMAMSINDLYNRGIINKDQFDSEPGGLHGAYKIHFEQDDYNPRR